MLYLYDKYLLSSSAAAQRLVSAFVLAKVIKVKVTLIPMCQCLYHLSEQDVCFYFFSSSKAYEIMINMFHQNHDFFHPQGDCLYLSFLHVLLLTHVLLWRRIKIGVICELSISGIVPDNLYNA